MEAESYPTVIESHSTSQIFKADGKISPAPLSGTAGVVHNYMLLVWFGFWFFFRTGDSELLQF